MTYLAVRLTGELPVRTFVMARYCGGGFPPALVRHRVAGLGEPLAAQTRRVGAARGDDGSASGAAQGIAPDGAAVRLRRDGELVVATVTARSPLLPGITIAAEAVAAAEPGPR
jgi:hypothetical protein